MTSFVYFQVLLFIVSYLRKINIKLDIGPEGAENNESSQLNFIGFMISPLLIDFTHFFGCKYLLVFLLSKVEGGIFRLLKHIPYSLGCAFIAEEQQN